MNNDDERDFEEERFNEQLMREEAEGWPTVHPMHVPIDGLWMHMVQDHTSREDLTELMEYAAWTNGIIELNIPEATLRSMHGRAHRLAGSQGCQYHPTAWVGCAYCVGGQS